MGINEKILSYLSVYGRENKYKLARALKTDVAVVDKALDVLIEEGRVKIETGKVILTTRTKPLKIKPKQKQEELPQAEETEEREEQPPQAETTEEKEAETEEVGEPEEEQPQTEESEEEQLKPEVPEEATEEKNPDE